MAASAPPQSFRPAATPARAVVDRALFVLAVAVILALTTGLLPVAGR